MTQTAATQLGADAIAPPALPVERNELPELHHLKQPRQTSATQLGRAAVAPPATHVANGDPDLVYHDIPPFPADVPTAPLLRLSLAKLARGDAGEKERLWRASCEVGFFYLDLRDADGGEAGGINGEGLIRDAAQLFRLGEKLYELPVAEKEKYDFKDRGSYFGYKALGAGVVDAKGTRDRNEFYNVSKDDLLGIGERLPAPEVLQDEGHRALLKGYMVGSHAVVTLLLGVLNEKLALPEGTLQGLHRLRAISGDQVRWVRSPPQPMDDRGKALGEHTDFGSLTLLFNRLGGLQILPPGESSQWCYVQPLKGHCVCNLGDAMVKFSAGVLRSNVHRVVNPPGVQGELTRMSLVYFARPEDEVMLRTLEGSEVIERAKREQGYTEDEERITAKEWILRRAMGRRADGDWKFAQGTEGKRAGMSD